MARTSPLQLVNKLNRHYQECSTGLNSASTYGQRMFWRARKYAVAELLAEMTDDDFWWGIYHSEYDAVMSEVFPGDKAA